MAATEKASIQLVLEFDQIWILVQQLSNTKQLELLEQLQKKLTKEKATPPQKVQYERDITPAELVRETPLVVNYFTVEEEAAEDGEEQEMTEEEFHQQLKKM